MSHNHEAQTTIRELKLIDIIKQVFISWIKKPKEKQKYIQTPERTENTPPENIKINYIAIVLDDRVEEVIRCENRLAALLLSNPVFVEFLPAEIEVQVGGTRYIDGNLQNTETEMLSEKINNLLENEKGEGRSD
jgi:hypothetical protein